MCKRAIPLRLGFFHGSAWYICVCRVYVHVCVHACLCETEDNLKCLSQASSTFVFVCGHTYVCTSVCAHVCRCMCRCICVHVETRGQLLVSPQSPFTLFFFFFFFGFFFFFSFCLLCACISQQLSPTADSCMRYLGFLFCYLLCSRIFLPFNSLTGKKLNLIKVPQHPLMPVIMAWEHRFRLP